MCQLGLRAIIGALFPGGHWGRTSLTRSMATRTFWQNNESHSGSNRFLAANACSGAAPDIYWPQTIERPTWGRWWRTQPTWKKTTGIKQHCCCHWHLNAPFLNNFHNISVESTGLANFRPASRIELNRIGSGHKRDHWVFGPCKAQSILGGGSKIGRLRPKRYLPASISLRTRGKTFISVIDVTTSSNVPNCESIPRVSSIRKKSTDQRWSDAFGHAQMGH